MEWNPWTVTQRRMEHNVNMITFLTIQQKTLFISSVSEILDLSILSLIRRNNIVWWPKHSPAVSYSRLYFQFYQYLSMYHWASDSTCMWCKIKVLGIYSSHKREVTWVNCIINNNFVRARSLEISFCFINLNVFILGIQNLSLPNSTFIFLISEHIFLSSMLCPLQFRVNYNLINMSSYNYSIDSCYRF